MRSQCAAGDYGRAHLTMHLAPDFDSLLAAPAVASMSARRRAKRKGGT